MILGFWPISLGVGPIGLGPAIGGAPRSLIGGLIFGPLGRNGCPAALIGGRMGLAVPLTITPDSKVSGRAILGAFGRGATDGLTTVY